MVEVDEREYHEVSEARGGRPWREVLLEALGINETPRRVGRPPRSALDVLQMGPTRMVSHDVRAENTGTDHRRVEGFDEDIFRKAQLERERLKREG
ncbi:hypothetical protein ISS40_07960 [Candidatus Bathyarchaeota archaeon]|nr:hypothetical protein [Candidatus Bathyarchaeota archaeon]